MQSDGRQAPGTPLPTPGRALRHITALASLAALLLATLGSAAAAPIVQELPYRFKVPGTFRSGRSYDLVFRLFDSPDPVAATTPLWEEPRRYKIPSSHLITHPLGSVVPLSNDGTALPPVDFSLQLWVEVGYGSKIIGGKRVALAPVVPYALHSENVLPGSVTTSAILDGTVAAADLQDGAALAEIADDDGSGSGLDADLLDGEHATAFAASGHAHDTDYVNEGQGGSVSSVMIMDGTITAADIADAAAIADNKLATITTAGKVASSALPSTVVHTTGAQTITGLKTYQTGSGVPFAVSAADSGTVANLSAEKVGGLTLADLDARHGILPPAPAGRLSWFSTVTADATGTVGLYSSITIGADGLPVASYYDQSNNDLKVLHCGSPACSAGNTIAIVDSDPYVGEYTSITIGADGLPVVSYFDNYLGAGLRVVHCGDATCSAGNTITTVDTGAGIGRFSAITVGADGFPIVSYYDSGNNDLKVLHCGNAACSSVDTITTVDSDGQVGEYSSITIGTNGLPVVSYHDETNFTLKLLLCGNLACSGGNTISTIDSSDGVGRHSSITIGADGLPVISYHDYYVGSLKILHCGNAACSADNTLTAIDTAGVAGRDTSIAIGANGFPVVSYRDFIAKDLKILHCGDAACSTGNTIATVDSDSAVGEFTSIAVGADGLPVLSYYDEVAGDLKVAKEFSRPIGRR